MLARVYHPDKNIKYKYNLYNSRIQRAYFVLFMYKQFDVNKHFVNGKLVNIQSFFVVFIMGSVHLILIILGFN